MPGVTIDYLHRRFVFQNASKWVIREVLGSLPHARSIICVGEGKSFDMPHNFRLLRTFKSYNGYGHGLHLGDAFQLVNSRHLAIKVDWTSKFPSSINLLWNLSTLIVYGSSPEKYVAMPWERKSRGWKVAPVEIWTLHQLRHLEFVKKDPDPPSEMVIMENLQTVRGVGNLNLNEEVVKRIPNVKKLHLTYQRECMKGLSKVKQMERANSFSYLECLSKLENFSCSIDYGYNEEYLQRISFPHSLKKFNLSLLYSHNVELEEILEKIGWLPLLQKLVLHHGRFKTGKWDTIEGQFRSLKLLELNECRGLENWTMAERFPVLQELRLVCLDRLEEIPSEVGEIATLKSIDLRFCSESAVVSAKRILEEQEDLYGDQLDLHVRALVPKAHKRLQSLASPNFEVMY